MSASDKMHLKLIQSQAKSYNKGITLKMPLLAPVHHFFGIQVNIHIIDLFSCQSTFTYIVSKPTCSVLSSARF